MAFLPVYRAFLVLLFMLLLVGGAYGTEISGIAEYGNDLDSAVSEIGSIPKVLRIDRPCIADREVVVPQTLKVVLTKTGLIEHGSNRLTFNGQLQAEEGRIFQGTGPVRINSSPLIRMEWFGIDPSKSAGENGEAIKRAMNSIPAHGGCKVVLNNRGNYHTAEALELTAGNVALGFGEGVSFTVHARNGLYIHGKDASSRIADITVKNFIMDGMGKTQHGILAMYCDRVVLERCGAWNNGADGIFIGGNGVNTSWDSKIVDCEVGGFRAFGIIAVGTHNLEVSGCRVTGCREARKCASAIQMKNSMNFNVHHNFTEGGEHGINIRCSSKGTDTTGICSENECRNAVKVGIYCHQDKGDGLTGELHDLIITKNRIHDAGWSLLSISAADGHWVSDIEVSENTGHGSGSHGMAFCNVKRMKWSRNSAKDITGKGAMLDGVEESTFESGVLERSAQISYPVFHLRKSQRNSITKLVLIQSTPSHPFIVEEESKLNSITSNTLSRRGDRDALRARGTTFPVEEGRK
ncbi:MAG: right-handed parallel beta-helix repeat-containing protein [Desulfobacteraceae bacterium]|nr:MAG: right-handed parallel beta-helix repeat-containing protein [Desulfobacteraceae bacterium]